jgi:hypothetical protein
VGFGDVESVPDWIARLLAERGRLRNALRRAEARRAAPGAAPADAG